MKEEHIWTKKPETMLDWFCVVGACIALYLALNNLGYFLGKIGVFIGIVSPFAGGIVIAYVLDPMVKEIYSMASAAMPQIVASIGSVASNFVAIFTSIAASIYMLADKEHLLHQLRTLAHAFLPEKAAENTLRICHYANVNFTGFFVGKIIDSAIIGVITFVAMAILRLDFALLISVFIGITNIIPVFGPFIGAIPSIFILLLVDPIQAVIFGVLILVIQQVDGNFIGPKILGSSIGISALWILFSIVVGGDLFGLVGMVVGVPLFATFYGLAREFVHYMLDKRGLDSEGNHVGEVVEDEENVFE